MKYSKRIFSARYMCV